MDINIVIYIPFLVIYLNSKFGTELQCYHIKIVNCTNSLEFKQLKVIFFLCFLELRSFPYPYPPFRSHPRDISRVQWEEDKRLWKRITSMQDFWVKISVWLQTPMHPIYIYIYLPSKMSFSDDWSNKRGQLTEKDWLPQMNLVTFLPCPK